MMLAAGLLPLAGGGIVVGFGLSRILSLSLGRFDPLLERAQDSARDPALSCELSQARIDLLQAELARRSLARLAPAALLAALVASAALLAVAAVALGRAMTRLVVVTPGSLGRVAHLLEGESDSALTRTLLGAIANDLTRSANGTCPVQPRR